MEYLDIYDSEGKSLGIVKSKKEAHDQGLWHRAVHIWIINPKGEVLIQKRSPLKDNNPDKWDISSAGHVSAGESDITSAIRETEEELGLTLPETTFTQIGIIKQMSAREGYINNEINPVYVVEIDIEIEKIKMQKEEVSEVKLLHFKELKKLIENNDPTFVRHPDEFKLLFDYLEKKYE